jgi:hypothetical protein
MSLLDKINDVMNNPSEVINSVKESPAITKSAVLLTMVAAATALNPMQAMAHQSDAPHVHYEYANIVGESVLVKDHIQNIADEHGISLDQHNDYLNYEHPQHSKINEYIDFVAENGSAQEFEELKELVEKAQKHYDNGHYSLIDSEAHYLMPVTDSSPIFLIDTTPEGESYDHSSVTHENTEAAITLFNKMANDSDFDYKGETINIAPESFEFHRTAIRNKADEKGFVMAYFGTVDDVVTNISVATWKYEGMDVSSKTLKQMSTSDGVLDYLSEGYELTEKDKHLLKTIAFSHELGHLNASGELILDKENTGPENEFLAEVMSTWEGVKAGGSEGYLEFRKDANNSTLAMVEDSHSHNGYGSLKTFYDQYSHEEVKFMSFDDITKNVNTFIESVPEDVLNFGEYSKILAKEEVKKNGIFPKAQEYFKNNGQEEKAELLNSAKTIPYTNTSDVFIEHLSAVYSPDSSFFESFTAEHFPSFGYDIIEKKQNLNHDSVVNYVTQLGKHMSSGEYLNSDFEYQKGDFQNAFDKAEVFANISDTVKIDHEGKVIIADNDITPTNHNLAMDYVTSIQKDNIIIKVEDDQYNEINFKIDKSGNITASLNQGDFENVSMKHFEGFDENSYNYNHSLNFIKDIAQNNTFEVTPSFTAEIESTPSFSAKLSVESTPSFEKTMDNPEPMIQGLQKEYPQTFDIDSSDEENELISNLSSEINDIEKQENKSDKFSNRGNRLSNS